MSSHSNFPNSTDEDLMKIIRTNGRPGWCPPQQAIDELQFRFFERMGTSTTNILESSNRLQELTKEMTESTKLVRQEVALLADSSGKLEDLTKQLIKLTWALIFLTVAAVLVPVCIEVWKAYQERPSVHVSTPQKP